MQPRKGEHARSDEWLLWMQVTHGQGRVAAIIGTIRPPAPRHGSKLRLNRREARMSRASRKSSVAPLPRYSFNRLALDPSYHTKRVHAILDREIESSDHTWPQLRSVSGIPVLTGRRYDCRW
jgi:hypothetical protein